MKVYGYPRSGNHFFMKILSMNFSSGRDNRSYMYLWQQHFDKKDGTPSSGDPPTVSDESICLVRDVTAVMRSIWRMRTRFGLTRHDSLSDFLLSTYRDSFETPETPPRIKVNVPGFKGEGFGLDLMFSQINELPMLHHSRYVQELMRRCRMVVRYEDLVRDPDRMIRTIGARFGYDVEQVLLPDEKVGYNVE